MITERERRVVLAVCAGIALLIAAGFIFMAYFGERLNESDQICIGTRQAGLSLLQYAQNHDGQFPASLQQSNFTATLDGPTLVYLQKFQPKYTPPSVAGSNIVRVLVAQSRWQTVVLYSDGREEVAPR
jgi:hypothetical protein